MKAALAVAQRIWQLQCVRSSLLNAGVVARSDDDGVEGVEKSGGEDQFFIERGANE